MRRNLLWEEGASWVSRLRSQSGFGLIDLLIAMTVTMVAVMALAASLTSSHVSLLRASRITTSAAIASAQLERYRGVVYAEIRLDGASVTSADGTYKGDVAYTAADAGTRVTASDCGSPVAEICRPSRTVTGADGRSYRLDTYIVSLTPTAGRAVKRVTVVVRSGTVVRVRESSAFDEATG